MAARILELTDSVKWERPKELSEAAWRDEVAPLLRRIMWQFSLGFLLLGAPIAIYCAHVLNLSLGSQLLRIGLAFFMIPVYLWIMMLLQRKERMQYEVGPNGFGGRRILYKWSRLQAYSFGDSHKVPGVRNLSLKIRGREFWECLSFRSGEVSEQELARIIAWYAPEAEERKDSKPTLVECEIDKRTKLRRLRSYGFMSVFFGTGCVVSIIVMCMGYTSGPVVASCFGCVVLELMSIGCFFLIRKQYEETIAQMVKIEKDADVPWYAS